MKKAISIFKITVIALLGLFLLINLWMLFSKIVLHRNLPKLFGFSQAVSISGSMEPEFLAGDMLIYSEKSAYSVGDVVIFNKNGDLVTHRIVDETAEGFITRGDANNTDDKGTISASDIEGKMTLVIPRIGEMLGFMKSPLGVVVLAIICVLLVALPDIIRFLQGRVNADGGKQTQQKISN